MGKKNTWKTKRKFILLDEILRLPQGPVKDTWLAPNHKKTIKGRPVARFITTSGGYEYQINTKYNKGGYDDL